MFGPCVVIFLVLQSSWWGRKRDGCFTLTVFLMSCYSQCSLALPHGALGCSAVCDCGIV